MSCYLLSDAIKEDKVKEDVKQAFLAFIFSVISQLKKTVANDHAKGDIEAFPSSCHAALTLMNDFKPLIIKGTAPVAAQGTALPRSRKELEHRLPALSAPIIRNTLLTCHNCGKLGHPSRCCPQMKRGKAKKDSEDNKLVSSNKSAKTIKSLSKQVRP
jgi:hypothetical protein